jgi:hypothetical protein
VFAFDATVTTLMIFDVAIALNTGYYKRGLLVYSRKLIARNYLRRWLVLDLLASFPYDWFVFWIDGPEASDKYAIASRSDEQISAGYIIWMMTAFKMLRIFRIS